MERVVDSSSRQALRTIAKGLRNPFRPQVASLPTPPYRLMIFGGRRPTLRSQLIAIGILALLFLPGCRAEAPALGLPPGAMVLHLAAISDVPTLDPAAGYDTESWMFEQMIFDTLVRYSDAGVDLVPDLATAWESSPDAKVFTFHLRRDALFTNGRPV